jgi:hypothetical protein
MKIEIGLEEIIETEIKNPLLSRTQAHNFTVNVKLMEAGFKYDKEAKQTYDSDKALYTYTW